MSHSTSPSPMMSWISWSLVLDADSRPLEAGGPSMVAIVKPHVESCWHFDSLNRSNLSFQLNAHVLLWFWVWRDPGFDFLIGSLRGNSAMPDTQAGSSDLLWMLNSLPFKLGSSTLLTERTSTLQGHHLENLRVAPKSHPSLRWRWLGSVLKVAKQHSLSRVSGWRIALHQRGNKISGALPEEAASGYDLLGIDSGDPFDRGAESELGRKNPTSDPWGF